MRSYHPPTIPPLELNWTQIQFFAHLTVAGLISPESMTALLQSFVAVLDEFGVSHGRAKKAALAAGEGLIIVGIPHEFHFHSPINCIFRQVLSSRLTLRRVWTT